MSMKPRIKLADSLTPEGIPMALYAHDGGYSISFKGQELMHSKASASELLLGKLGVEQAKPGVKTRIMIGGLGLGFTLRSVLDGVGPDAEIDLIELMPQVVKWNREHLYDLNGALLDDPRVNVIEADAVEMILAGNSHSYDVLILDVDNGPTGMVKADNDSLYSHRGLRAVRKVLKAEGRVVYWSAGPDPNFQARMETVGFSVDAVPAKVHERAKRAAYLIYVGDM
ncbi:MAG: spermine synthase [Verrucomicrobiota bacterium]